MAVRTRTGKSAGRAVEPRKMRFLQGADAVLSRGRQHRCHCYLEMESGSAWSKTPETRGSSTRGTREVACLALNLDLLTSGDLLWTIFSLAQFPFHENCEKDRLNRNHPWELPNFLCPPKERKESWERHGWPCTSALESGSSPAEMAKKSLPVGRLARLSVIPPRYQALNFWPTALP